MKKSQNMPVCLKENDFLSWMFAHFAEAGKGRNKVW
jgi:hypothetical protein